MEIANTKLAVIFEDDIETIINLCRADPDFTEICSDFLSLCEFDPVDAATDRQVADSLSGLEDEIRKYLANLKNV